MLSTGAAVLLAHCLQVFQLFFDPICRIMSGVQGGAARMVPAARMVALVEHVANSTSESNPWHRNISQVVQYIQSVENSSRVSWQLRPT